MDDPTNPFGLGVSGYADAPTLRFPELIELFGDPMLKNLAKVFATNPDKMTWLLKFQNEGFQVNMAPETRRAGAIPQGWRLPELARLRHANRH